MTIKPNCLEGYKLFHAGTLALSRMEANGVLVDRDYLVKTLADSERLTRELEKKFKSSSLYKAWERHFGLKTNIQSPNQLTKMLSILGLDTGKRTATGRMQVDKQSLGSFDLPELKDYLTIKENHKTVGTYLKGVLRELDDDNILHPFYNLASGDDDRGGAESFRSSCSQPNFQNFPKRNKVMRDMVRRSVRARKGRRLVSRDFSGIEVKVAACVTKDPKLREYVTDDTTDMHRDEACNLFCLKPHQVEKSTTRDFAKNMWVFPQLYGSAYFQCAPPIWEAMEKRNARVGDITLREHLRKNGITELGDCSPDARTRKGSFVDHLKGCEVLLWTLRFPVYTQWKKDWYAEYLERGWFPLSTGFICQGYYRRNQVLNFAIQGQAFHCMLWSIIEVEKELRRRKMKTLLVGQVHDDLLSDVPDEEVQEYLEITDDIMHHKLLDHWDWITVPIKTEVEVTPVNGTWLDGETWERSKGGVWRAKPKAA